MLCMYCVVASLSIAAAQSLVIPLILSWIVFSIHNKEKHNPFNSTTSIIATPIATWLLASLVSTIVGVEPLVALEELAKTSLYIMLPFCVYSSIEYLTPSISGKIDKVVLYLSLLVCSQTIAALHTVIQKTFDIQCLPSTPGAVTESGQLVLVIPFLLILGAIANTSSIYQLEKKAFSNLLTPQHIIECCFLLSLLMLSTWPSVFTENQLLIKVIFSITFTAYILFTYYRHPLKIIKISDLNISDYKQWFKIAAVLMLAALILNLKRGPWMGVAIELMLLGLFLSRRLFLIVCLTAIFSLVLFEPVRDRMLSIGEHFNIDGGRRYMWSLGIELVQRYPLGIGPDNSQYMQTIDPTLPRSHEHMHNNFLNVLVESGWLGLAAYIWWIFITIKLGFLIFLDSFKQKDPSMKLLGLLALTLSVSFIGWQTAGFVEYNFGDGEIRLIAFFSMGLLLTLQELHKKKGLLKATPKKK